MAEQPLEMTWRTALWRQFGAAIDMLANALESCPDTLWQEHLWIDAEGPDYGTFWAITYHTLRWLDLYLTGCSLEDFTPALKKKSDSCIPRDEIRTYLVQLREKCQTAIAELSDEKARQPVDYPWTGEKPMSYLELLLYTLRHVQEHAAQLSLFLGQHGIAGEALDWVPRAQGEASQA